MSLTLNHPREAVDDIILFLKKTFEKQGKKNAVIAVSGGIDSALSLTLLSKALPVEHIYPVLLPYGDQSVLDSETICDFNNIPNAQKCLINIQSAVTAIESTLYATEFRLDPPDQTDEYRRGNIMARMRMVFVYDLAKKLDALVVGTENKSEKHLAYFTRFGDEASDIEPIVHLYKTQVRQLATLLHIPLPILTKAPSAGLWLNQTDESELGFSYEQADRVMEEYIDAKKKVEQIQLEGISTETVRKIVQRIDSQHFKHEVPYKL